MAIEYRQIPIVSQWKKDSSVRMARRKSDPILSRIDELVDAQHQCPDENSSIYVHGQLFFSIDFWLKNIRNKHQEADREPAMMALYKCVVDNLCRSFDVTPNVLPRELELHYGRVLGDHGTKLDRDLRCADYLTRAEVKKYALRWKGGKAYQFPHWKPSAGKGSKLELVDSSRFENPAVNIDAGFGGFAMSMSRTIYMAKHHCTKGAGAEGNHYHSSYLAGEPVLCAGTMKIVQGVVQAIQTNSGHYQPVDDHILNVLELLKMLGAPLGPVRVIGHGGLNAKATDFYNQRGNWPALLARRNANVKTMRAVGAGTKDRVDEFICDIWKNPPVWMKTEADYYGYLSATYGWSDSIARDRAQRAWQRFGTKYAVGGGGQPGTAHQLGMAPGRPR